MTGPDPDVEPADPPACTRRCRDRFAVPLDLTRTGQRAFEDEVRDFAAQLARQLDLDAQRTRCADREFTADHVRKARRSWEQRIGDRARADAADNRVGAALLVTIGSVGSSVMAGHLNSQWQVGLFGLFAVAGVVGLVLTWTSRPRRVRDDPG